MRTIYLFLLAAIVGLELGIGILFAPAIFKANELLGGDILSRLQSGIIMSSIFVKFNYILLAVAAFSFIIEGFGYFKKQLGFRLRFSKLMLAVIVLALSLLFVFYFSSYILNAASLGSVDTQAFAKMHQASEFCLKLITIAQLLLFFLSSIIVKKC